MKTAMLLSAVAVAAMAPFGLALNVRGAQPIYSPEEKGRDYYNNKDFAKSAADEAADRPPNFRSAWDDCGGVGASATERMRSIAATIKGWAKRRRRRRLPSTQRKLRDHWRRASQLG